MNRFINGKAMIEPIIFNENNSHHLNNNPKRRKEKKYINPTGENLATLEPNIKGLD